MKTTARISNYFLGRLMIAAGALATLVASGKPVTNENQSVVAVLQPAPKSTFIIPASLQEGRDPFYPNSTRTPGSSPAPKEVRAVAEASPLVLNGLNLMPGNRTAIINGRTIAEGETAEIPTAGGPVSVHCLEIKKENSVVVQVGTQTQELHMRGE